MNKKLKHIIPITMAAIIAASIPTVSSFAEKIGEEIRITNEHSLLEMERQDERENYILLAGQIKDIRQGHEGSIFALVSDSDEEYSGIQFGVSSDTLLLDQRGEKVAITSLQIGDTVKVYYRKDQLMALSMPPMTFAPIFIVEKEGSIGFTELAFFNENLINLNNTLQLNIAEETQISDQQGNPKTKEDLVNQELLVFYDITTRSIPAQTTPQKVILLAQEEQALKETMENIDTIIADDFIMVEGNKMIPLRKVAEYLGYEVSWMGDTQQVELRLQASSFLMTIGEKTYAYNRSLGQFEQAPLLHNHKTYVSQSFIDRLMQ